METVDDNSVVTTYHRVLGVLGKDIRQYQSYSFTHDRFLEIANAIEDHFDDEGLRSRSTREADLKVALPTRHLAGTDLLAQLLLYVPVVAVPDPLFEWVTDFRLTGMPDPKSFEEALSEHRALDHLAARGFVDFFPIYWRDDDRSEERYFLASDLASDPSLARAFLGELPVDDEEWRRHFNRGADLPTGDRLAWEYSRPDIDRYVDKVHGECHVALPPIEAAADVGASLCAVTPQQRAMTLGYWSDLDARTSMGAADLEVTTRLQSMPVPFLDALQPGLSVDLREDSETWYQWRRELQKLVGAHATTATTHPALAVELIQACLSDRIREVEKQAQKSRVAPDVFREAGVMDIAAACIAWTVSGNPLAAVPSVAKALLSPPYRAMIQRGPSGADAVLLALRSNS